jgi:hypothetical protein
LLKIGYISFNNLYTTIFLTTEKYIQGSILSPFFCNIYLSSFDYYINNILFKDLRFNNNFCYNIFKDINKFLDFCVSKKKINFNKLQKNIQEISNKSSFIFRYVRYINDFLCGFKGSKQLGYSILLACSH